MQHLVYGSNSLITQPKDTFYSIPTNTALSASSIDQHRNQIQQRIANLQAKISKKYNAAVELDRRGSSQNYLIGYGNNSGVVSGSQLRSRHQGNMSVPYVRIQDSINRGDSVVSSQNLVRNSMRNAEIGGRQGQGLEYVQRYTQGIDQLALRQRKKYDYGTNTNTNDNRPQVGLKASYGLNATRQQSQPIPNQSKQPLKPTTVTTNPQKANSTQHQIKKQSSIKKPHKPQQPPFCIQTQFQQLNKTISNLRSFTNGIEDYRTTIRNHQNGRGTEGTENKELYDMMRSIMVGQERLEKELERLKGNNEMDGLGNRTVGNSPFRYRVKDRSRSKSERMEKSRRKTIEQRSPYQNKSKSPLNKKGRSRSKSPYNQKGNPSNKQNNRGRSPSVNPKDSIEAKQGQASYTQKAPQPHPRSRSTTTGCIRSNKQRFQQMYVNAHRSKKLCPSEPLTISHETISVIQQRIKRVIQRSQRQNSDTSNLSHQNKRYLKDQLMNTIELQRKLKGDLVKKVYEMCPNKILYK